MLKKATIDRIIPILRKDARRALKMKVKGFPKPYFCSFLLRDINWFNTWASSGSMYRRRSDHTRNVYCDIRVGSYRYDQTTDGGLNDNDEEVESYSHVTVPIDDKHYEGLRIALWRLSEAKFREAISDYNLKEAARVSTVNVSRKFHSFIPVKPKSHRSYKRPTVVDEQKWVRFCKKASRYLSELPLVTGNWVEFDATQETKIFVSTEGATVVQHQKIFTLSAVLRNLTKEGSQIEQEIVINTTSLNELPDFREFKRLADEKHERLAELTSAKMIHSFSGPVLLYPIPAGVMFHEALGHRVEGNRFLSTGEGQTFKGQIGKKILNTPIDIRDNPNLKRFKGRSCVGAYDYDDEGVRAQDTLLMEDGFLKDFLGTRAATKKRGYQSNGHARNKKFQRPISRMGVTIIEGKDTCSMDKLRERLLKEIRRQKKPCGMIIYESSGGETDTTSFDFQAFYGEVSFASLIYPDGREEVIRGVNFVGTPLQAVNNVIAVGDTQELDNSYCGAESGFIPVSTISPAVLLRNLELQSKDEELVTQYILPKPKL